MVSRPPAARHSQRRDGAFIDVIAAVLNDPSRFEADVMGTRLPPEVEASAYFIGPRP